MFVENLGFVNPAFVASQANSPSAATATINSTSVDLVCGQLVEDARDDAGDAGEVSRRASRRLRFRSTLARRDVGRLAVDAEAGDPRAAADAPSRLSRLRARRAALRMERLRDQLEAWHLR